MPEHISGAIKMIPYLISHSLEGKELDFISETISNGQIAGNQMFSKEISIFSRESNRYTQSALDHIVYTRT